MESSQVSAAAFVSEARGRITTLVETQAARIGAAADILTRVIVEDGVVQCFGTGHSRAISLELAGRAGGLYPFSMIAIKDLALRGGERPEDILDPELERDPEIARRLWKLHQIGDHDALVLVSNSGRNAATVEMAALARASGLPVIVITSLAHSARVTSTHSSGRMLADFADVVIDNGAPYGDAVLPLPDGRTLGGLSTLTGVLIAQMLVAEIASRLLAQDREIPVLVSLNTPEGAAWNDRLEARYRERVWENEA